MKIRARLGTATHVSASSGNLILRAARETKIGQVVTSGKGKRIGVVFDVFGPVESPFVAVRPRIEDPERLVRKDLFIERKER